MGLLFLSGCGIFETKVQLKKNINANLNMAKSLSVLLPVLEVKMNNWRGDVLIDSIGVSCYKV